VAITASDLRQDVYRILDSVLESGQPIEVERRGRRLKIVPAEPASKLGRLVHRPEFLRVDPEAIVSLDWSETWRP
jgi:hypothetical protein